MNRHDWPLQVAIIAAFTAFNVLIFLATRS